MITFIVNPSSGGGRCGGIWKKIEEYLMKQNIEYNAFITSKSGDAKSIAAKLSENLKEEKTVIAVGGDGTINEVLEGAVISHNLILACIPAGTGNDLARGLKLPKNPIDCLKKIIEANEINKIDYGILSFGNPEHRRFLVSAGIGFDAEIVHSIIEQKKKNKNKKSLLNRLYYVRIGLKKLFDSKAVKGYIIIDEDKKVEFNNIMFISVHNHPYEGGGFMFAPGAKNMDGKLSVCIVHEKSKLKLAFILLSALFGKHIKKPGVRLYTGKEMKVHIEESMYVHIDGEGCGLQKTVEFDCVQKQLRFIY